ncbi:hypothetical protein CRG98_019364 [Punica granatum]|uniref:Uncharacterized protein n=1 Tax=Punica granatum TaxID=22663 RepID=A0A2I0JVA3_PUNGR|nr:hypothetical protein CRG98_019364 [Punica granatum]
MQPKRGKLSAPHFGPPASHTRISDRGPGHYSSPGNQRQVGEHGVMSNRRRARSTEKSEESHRKNERIRNPRNDGADTVALFIIESLKHRKACTKNKRGSRDAKLHSERPNRAKPTPVAPSRPNVRPHDAWRYWARSNSRSSSIPNLQINWTSEDGCKLNRVSSIFRLFSQSNGTHSSAKPSHQAAARPQAMAQTLKPRLSRNKPRLAPMAGGSSSPPPQNSNLLTPLTHPSHLSPSFAFPYTQHDIFPSSMPL